MTMKMISSTNTTSTSGVMLMLACMLPGSPSRMSYLRHFHSGHLGFRHFNFRHFDFRDFEQAVHELRRRTVHLNVKRLDLLREAVECHNSRDSDENTQRCRNQRFSDTA